MKAIFGGVEMIDSQVIFDYMREHEAEFSDLRQQFHRDPEVGLDLPKTVERIVNQLKLFKVDEVHTGIGGGVVAVVNGKSESDKWIGIRADMDALPLQEEAHHQYCSINENCMHACGHDGHITMALAACRYLCEHRELFEGTVAFIFQPGEEGYAGARLMIEDGLFEKFPIAEVYATHGEPADPVGTIGVESGYTMASADIFDIQVEGKGGHGARPHEAIDSVLVASHIVVAAQSVVSRNVDPLKGAVVTFGAILAGAENGSSVLPQKAKLVGTCRSFEPEVRDLVQSRLKGVVEGVALSLGARAKLNYTRLYPSLYCHPQQSDSIKHLVVKWLGRKGLRSMKPQMIAEDFSFMMNVRPGCLFRTGLRDKEHEASLHHRTFDFNDKAIKFGATVLASVAIQRLEIVNT